jgi:hypothetical protein
MTVGWSGMRYCLVILSLILLMLTTQGCDSGKKSKSASANEKVSDE